MSLACLDKGGKLQRREEMTFVQSSISSNPWRNFFGGSWQTRVDVRGFIEWNNRSYEGVESFLTDPTDSINLVAASRRHRSSPILFKLQIRCVLLLFIAM